MKIKIALILLMVALLGLDFGADESKTIFESVENILESKLGMFLASVVAAQCRPKKCTKSIAIFAMACVSLTVLLMSGQLALFKVNSEELLQFCHTMAQFFTRSG